MEIRNFLKKFVRAFTNEHLEELSNILQDERKKRNEMKLKQGNYENPIESELTGNKPKAIMAYRERTGNDVYFSKMVIDKYWKE